MWTERVWKSGSLHGERVWKRGSFHGVQSIASVETWQLSWSPMDSSVWILGWWSVSAAGNGCSGMHRLSVSRQLVMDTVERSGLSIKCSICSYQWTTGTDGERSVWETLRRFVLMESHEFQFCLALCFESLRILSLFMHLHGSRSLSCHLCFVCASFHPHVIHVCLAADWHLDCTRFDPFWLSSFDIFLFFFLFFFFTFFCFFFLSHTPSTCHTCTTLVFSHSRTLSHDACAQPIVWFERERKLRAGHRAETRQTW